MCKIPDLKLHKSTLHIFIKKCTICVKIDLKKYSFQYYTYFMKSAQLLCTFLHNNYRRFFNTLMCKNSAQNVLKFTHIFCSVCLRII